MSLELINARDLGFAYASIPVSLLTNIHLPENVDEAREIPQFVHCGGSCGYPGGCNNMSPNSNWLDNCQITDLPADITLFLWRQRPSGPQAQPDFRYTIHYR